MMLSTLTLALSAPRKPPGGTPAANANAQLVLNAPAKTGFTFWIRLL